MLAKAKEMGDFSWKSESARRLNRRRVEKRWAGIERAGGEGEGTNETGKCFVTSMMVMVMDTVSR